MKKIFLSLTLAAVSFLALASPPKNNSTKDRNKELNTYPASQTLHGLYGTVENLKWSKAKENMLRADFVIDGESFSSFFDPDGQYVATTSEKTIDQLPAVIRKSIKHKFKDKEITNIVHYNSASDDSYFVEVADNRNIKVFRFHSNGGISRFK